jgi:hypothetical protein
VPLSPCQPLARALGPKDSKHPGSNWGGGHSICHPHLQFQPAGIQPNKGMHTDAPLHRAATLNKCYDKRRPQRIDVTPRLCSSAAQIHLNAGMTEEYTPSSLPKQLCLTSTSHVSHRTTASKQHGWQQQWCANAAHPQPTRRVREREVMHCTAAHSHWPLLLEPLHEAAQASTQAPLLMPAITLLSTLGSTICFRPLVGFLPRAPRAPGTYPTRGRRLALTHWSKAC